MGRFHKGTELLLLVTRDGKLARNPLEGDPGDVLHAVICGAAGHNIRLLIRKLWHICDQIWLSIKEALQAIWMTKH